MIEGCTSTSTKLVLSGRRLLFGGKTYLIVLVICMGRKLHPLSMPFMSLSNGRRTSRNPRGRADIARHDNTETAQRGAVVHYVEHSCELYAEHCTTRSADTR